MVLARKNIYTGREKTQYLKIPVQLLTTHHLKRSEPMPYITKKLRELYQDEIDHFEALHAAHITDGELNYLLSSLCHSVLKKQGLKYSKINMLIGVLNCVELELYRTVASDYEDLKREQNGSVSILDATTSPPKPYSAEQRRAIEDAR